MHTKHRTFLIVCLILLCTAGVYSYFSHGNPALADTGLASSSGNVPSPFLGAGVNQITLDTAFLSSLVALNKIKIDNSLFSNQAFRSLHDNTVSLEQATAGRSDPFAPIEGATTIRTLATVVTTNEPTQVATKSAIFNGAVTSTDKISASYFEYGPTPSLGQVTPIVAQSLVGTFVAKVANLSPQTVYFYRAVIKSNGVIIYGDIISFNTK